MNHNFTILYSIGSLSSKGGTERVLSTKSSYFAEQCGIEVHICTQGADNYRAYEFSSKINFHNLYDHDLENSINIPLITNQRYKHRLYAKYENLLLKIRPNVVIVLERGTDDFFLPSICHRIGIPIVREFHFAKNAVYERAKIIEDKISRFKYFFSYQRIFHAFNHYDYLVLLTRKDQQESNYKTKSIVIPNMVEFSQTPSNYCNKRAITVGSMNDNRKGFDTLIKLWPKVLEVDDEWRLDIYGSGAKKQYLQHLIEEYHLDKNVHLCGVSSNIQDEYASSSLYLSASVAEGLPMVMIEAMACGLPCVAFDCPTGPSDIITDGLDGFLAPNHNDKVLFRQLKSLILNPDKIKQMGKMALKKSIKFSPENILPLWLDFFKTFGYEYKE